MIGDKKVICVVPARLKSTRFPNKVLTSIHGKPTLQWIFESASQCAQFDEIIFAVDHLQTAQLVESFGANWIMTNPDCLNGTCRLIEVMEKGDIKGDIWVNWQGDEPFIHSKMIDDLLPEEKLNLADVWTLKKKIVDLEEIDSPSVVKVVTDHFDRALYFSRSPIPFERESGQYFKHVGLYAYSQEALSQISSFEESKLEIQEGLEQLGFLYHGLKIAVFQTQFETLGIDTPEDLKKAQLFDMNQHFQVS
ncbi:MAG: 3-deoxy-manno-octulosonate cytidylyltransferase [Rhabdochlamydiaceae bacterium]|nr:3-deoxy-manno-octulosonate cytidylyltransferase [Candidatus Amphrikana amoebophyrae]